MSDGASSKDAAGKDAALDITIPRDLTGCQALIEQLACTVDSQHATIDSQTQTIEQLREEKKAVERAFAEYVQRLFRKRSERYLNNPDQLRLDLGDSDVGAAAAEGLAEAVEEAEQPQPQPQPDPAPARRPHRRKPRNEALPEHLPRHEVEASVPDDVKHCPEHGSRVLIGYDSVETLKMKRPELYVQVTKYPKYACQGHAECGVSSAERPTGLVEGDRYDTSVATEIITSKYGYHLPVYRQQDLFAESGWTPTRSTLLNILTASAFVLRPLVEHIKQVVLGGDLVGTDDTRVTLLLPATIPRADVNDPKSQRIHEVFSEAIAAGRPSVTARMWAYRSLTEPLNVFDFTVSRHRDGPTDMLANFRGTLQADCYAGYEGIALRSGGDIRRAACVTHARRKIFDAKEAYPLESSVVLAKLQQLYDIEDRAKEMSADDRLGLRQSESVEVWASLDAWRQGDVASRVLPKSQFGQALGLSSQPLGTVADLSG